MNKIRSAFSAAGDWLFTGKRLPILIVLFIVIATAVTVITVTNINGDKPDTVTAFVTIEGFGDGVDFEKRRIEITEADSVAQIFSPKYPEIYESFGKPLVHYNRFTYFKGIREDANKSFHVMIDGKHETDLTQAFVYGGQIVTISYY